MTVALPSPQIEPVDIQAVSRRWWRLDLAELLTALAIPLAAVAALAGLLAPDIYGRNPTGLVPALRGQDLVTLVALPALVAALRAAGRGSARATLLWAGLLGYLWYTYTGAALGYAFGPFTLLYIALFGLLVFAAAAMAGGIDAAALEGRFDAAAPRRPVAVFLVLVGLVLAGLEIGQNVRYLATGAIPPGVAVAGGGSYFVYGLDLGIVAPLTMLAAAMLWRRSPWGVVLAGCLLIKGATMGLALLSMNWFMGLAGQPADAAELVGFYLFLAAGGLGMTAWLLRHCH